MTKSRSLIEDRRLFDINRLRELGGEPSSHFVVSNGIVSTAAPRQSSSQQPMITKTVII
ncbi:MULTISPECIES: hypothetical protein [Burkholderia]|jgi:hypothetical protein|uniref:hypothetical protein n=1 Tax=Burkholderia TaxID=32008 RepID=UPI00158853B3|nr:hypothetical protein [Burkholderia ambifaria]MBR8183810.1 hypothetical protein [Burkholderia ambifaria]QQJ98896.1 hypothetical protein JG536_23015 [Burkholderia ambifaria]UEP38550.1 hypothetical protein LL998_21635 [Burkholderia ambifaria]